MEFEVDAPVAAVSLAVRRVMPAVETRVKFPVLQCASLEVSAEGVFTVTGTDVDETVTCTVPGAAVSGHGQIIIPAGGLMKVVSAMPSGGSLRITAKDQELKLKCEGSRSTLRGQVAERYPSIPSIDNLRTSATIPGPDLALAAAKVLHAVPSGGTSGVIKGALLHLDGDNSKLVATDGVRLYIAQLPGIAHDPVREDERDIILSRAALQMVAELGDGLVAVNIDDSFIFLTSGDWRLASRRLEGNYPAYRNVLRGLESDERKARFSRETLVHAVESALIIGNQISLTVAPGEALVACGGKVGKKGSGIEGEEAEIGLDCGWTGGEQSTVFLRGEYLLDALTSIGHKEVDVLMPEAREGLVLVCASQEADQAVMAQRIMAER